MPSKKRQVNKSGFADAQITINDSANASKVTGRLAKGFYHAVSKRNCDDLFMESSTEINADAVEKPSLMLEKASSSKLLKNANKKEDDTFLKFNCYSLDLWFLLSEYIDPENVGAFALICHASYFITTTTTFYKRLWQRCSPLNNPLKCTATEKLICRNMEKVFLNEKKENIRANVIRALHYCYPPFLEQSNLKYLQRDLSMLEGSQCIMQWHNTNNYHSLKKYVFCFKFQFGASTTSNIFISQHKTTEDNCCVLHVVCTHFIDLSRTQVSGLVLTNSSITINSDMASQKMKLVFHKFSHKTKCPQRMKYQDITGVQLVLPCVASHQISQWWEPSYPFKNIKHYHM